MEIIGRMYQRRSRGNRQSESPDDHGVGRSQKQIKRKPDTPPANHKLAGFAGESLAEICGRLILQWTPVSS